MALLISPHHRDAFSHILDEMFALRHKVFVRQLKWQGLKSPDGLREIDEFDSGPCHYLLGFRPDGRVANAVRITGAPDPNVTCDVLAPQMGWRVDRATHYLEMSRMCADPDFSGPDAKIAYLDLMASVADVCTKFGYRGSIGVGAQSEIEKRIRAGDAIQIRAGPFTFPGDSEPSYGIVLESDPDGRLDQIWNLLDRSRHGLQDPDNNPELFVRFRRAA
ncbi:MAG: acyl-homoserine-lactone synthase [Caulobacterales bacterium]